MSQTHEYFWRFEDGGDNWHGPFKNYTDCVASIPFAQMMPHEIEVRPIERRIIIPGTGDMIQ